MNWKPLESTAALQTLENESHEHPILIFKHSTSCSISGMALNRLERAWNDQETQGTEAYFLDLIRYRDVSRQVAESFRVEHQSPQVLLIHKGECVYNTSHMGISYQALKDQLAVV